MVFFLTRVYTILFLFCILLVFAQGIGWYMLTQQSKGAVLSSETVAFDEEFSRVPLLQVIDQNRTLYSKQQSGFWGIWMSVENAGFQEQILLATSSRMPHSFFLSENATFIGFLEEKGVFPNYDVFVMRAKNGSPFRFANDAQNALFLPERGYLVYEKQDSLMLSAFSEDGVPKEEMLITNQGVAPFFDTQKNFLFFLDTSSSALQLVQTRLSDDEKKYLFQLPFAHEVDALYALSHFDDETLLLEKKKESSAIISNTPSVQSFLLNLVTQKTTDVSSRI